MQINTAFISEFQTWLNTLDLADLLGVIGFFLSVLILFVLLIKGIISIINHSNTNKYKVKFQLEDVNYEIFKKKGYVSFDLYIHNNGRTTLDIVRAGLVLSDKSERTIYEESHMIKLPDTSTLTPGGVAFYNDCDLYYILNDKGVCYKKIIGFFLDTRNHGRIFCADDVHPLLNDQTIRGNLTDKKGLNGF